MILSAALIDRTFHAQTAETFEAPFPPKVGAFQVLEQAIDIESLDFLVTVSSVSAMFGNAGQTNYASANTALAGLTKKYKNAFCMVCPAIIDSAIALKGDVDDVYRRRLRHLTDWGMSASELCTYLGDGIRKLRNGAVWQYVPNFDWPRVAANMGISPVFKHLLPESSTVSADEAPGTSNMKEIICKILEVAPNDLAPDVPLTAYGLDSLSATSLSTALAPIVAISQIQLLADVTLQQLEARVEEAGSSGSAQVQADTAEIGEVDELLALVERYGSDFPSVQPKVEEAPASPGRVVLITGSRGSLGAHALARFVLSAEVSKVYALLRKSDATDSLADRQRYALAMRGIDPCVVDSDKLELIEGLLTEPLLGLQEEAYEQIHNTVTHVVHLGWNINLATHLKAFEPDIRGLRALIDFSATARKGRQARLVYASSVGIFRQLEYLSDISAPITESALPDPRVSIGPGYSESKWVSERLLDIAMEKIPGFSATTIRIHQLTGGLNGAWKPSEWFPALVSASMTLGCFPDGRDTISWMPVDMAAAAMVDFLDCRDTVLHLRHPKPIPWSDMANPLARIIDARVVPYAEWLARLEHEWKAQGIRQISPFLEPAIRLMDVYRSTCPDDHPARPITESNGLFPMLSIDKALRASPTLQDPDLPPIQESDIAAWIRYWRHVHALPGN